MKFIANKNLRSFSYNGTIISIYPGYATIFREIPKYAALILVFYPGYAKNWQLKINYQYYLLLNLKLPLHAFQLISLRLLLCHTAHERLESNVLLHNQPADTN